MGDQDEIQGLKDRLSRFKERFDRSISIQGLTATNQLLEEVRRPHSSNKTGIPYQATNSDEIVLRRLNTRRPTRSLRCYKNNRKDLRLAIDKWVGNLTTGTANVLRISGYPGIGKSTVIFQASIDLRKQYYLGFIIDFDRTSQSETNPKVVWSSISVLYGSRLK